MVLSTHDLTQRSTIAFVNASGIPFLSTHDLTQRSTKYQRGVSNRYFFQLTTSRRGRRHFQIGILSFALLSTHDLTQRSTALLIECCFVDDLSTHDLTQRSTSDQDDANSAGSFQLTTSRRGRLIQPRSVSDNPIFQLTTSRRGRRTLLQKQAPSTHNFQLTTSRRGRRCGAAPPQEILNFQLTTSRRGRHQCGCFSRIIAELSTHDLTQRSTGPD